MGRITGVAIAALLVLLPGLSLAQTGGDGGDLPQRRVLDVQSGQTLAGMNVPGNGTKSNPWRFEHQDFSNSDGVAIRIENLSGYVRIHNVTAAGTVALYVKNVTGLEVDGFNASADVHGIVLDDVRVLQVNRTNVTAGAHGLWIKGGNGDLREVRVFGARDGIVLDGFTGTLALSTVTARDRGVVGHHAKGTLQNVIVQDCRDAGMEFQTGTLALRRNAVLCGERGIHARGTRSLALENNQVENAENAIVLEYLADATLRGDVITNPRDTGLTLTRASADVVGLRAEGGRTGIHLHGADASIRQVTIANASDHALQARGSLLRMQEGTYEGSPVALRIETSEVRFDHPGPVVRKAGVGLLANHTSFDGEGVLHVTDLTAPAVGAKLNAVGDASTRDRKWAGVHVDGANAGVLLDEGSQLGLGALDVRNATNAVILKNGSSLHLGRQYYGTRDDTGTFNLTNVQVPFRVESRALLWAEDVAFPLDAYVPFAYVEDASLQMDGVDVTYPDTPPPAHEVAALDLVRAAAVLNQTTLTRASIGLRINGLPEPRTDTLPRATVLQATAFLDTHHTAINGKAAVLRVIGGEYGSERETYHHGLRLTGESGFILQSDTLGLVTYKPRFWGASEADLEWHPDLSLPLSTAFPPHPDDPTKTVGIPGIFDAQVGRIRMANVTDPLHLVFNGLTARHVTLTNVAVYINGSAIGVKSPYRSPFTLPPANESGLFSTLADPAGKPFFVVNGSDVGRVVLEGHGGEAYIQDSHFFGAFLWNGTGDGPVLHNSRSEHSRPLIHVKGGPARVIGTNFYDRVSGRAPVLQVEDASFVTLLNNRFPDRAEAIIRDSEKVVFVGNAVNDTLQWTNASGTLAVNNFSRESVIVTGTGFEDVLVADNVFNGSLLVWGDAKGRVEHNDFLFGRPGGFGTLSLWVNHGETGPPATPEIQGNRFLTNGTAIFLDYDPRLPASYDAGRQYEREGRIANNLFRRPGAPLDESHAVAVADIRHGRYFDNEYDDQTGQRLPPTAHHEPSEGVRLYGNTFWGGPRTHCHYFYGPRNFVDSAGRAHTVYDDYTRDPKYRCTPVYDLWIQEDEGPPVYSGSEVGDPDFEVLPYYEARVWGVNTHHYGGGATGPVGPRNVTAETYAVFPDPWERQDAPPPPVQGRTGGTASPCRGYAIQRLQLNATVGSAHATNISLGAGRLVHATGSASLLIVGDHAGDLCDKLADIQVQFLDGDEVIENATAAAFPYTFSYLPQTGNLTMRVTLDSKAPEAGKQERVATYNMTGLSTSLGFIPYPSGKAFDAAYGERLLTALKGQIPAAEFAAAIAAVAAALALVGISVEFDSSGRIKGGHGSTPGDGGGGDGPPPTAKERWAAADKAFQDKYWEKADALTGKAADGNVYSIPIKARLLQVRDVGMKVFGDYYHELNDLNNLDDSQKLAFMQKLQRIINQYKTSANFAENPYDKSYRQLLEQKIPLLALKPKEMAPTILNRLEHGGDLTEADLAWFSEYLDAGSGKALDEYNKFLNMDTVEQLMDAGDARYRRLHLLAVDTPQAAKEMEAMAATAEGVKKVEEYHDALRDTLITSAFAAAGGIGGIARGVAGSATSFTARAGSALMVTAAAGDLGMNVYSLAKDTLEVAAAREQHHTATVLKPIFGEETLELTQARIDTATKKGALNVGMNVAFSAGGHYAMKGGQSIGEHFQLRPVTEHVGDVGAKLFRGAAPDAPATPFTGGTPDLPEITVKTPPPDFQVPRVPNVDADLAVRVRAWSGETSPLARSAVDAPTLPPHPDPARTQPWSLDDMRSAPTERYSPLDGMDAPARPAQRFDPAEIRARLAADEAAPTKRFGPEAEASTRRYGPEAEAPTRRHGGTRDVDAATRDLTPDEVDAHRAVTDERAARGTRGDTELLDRTQDFSTEEAPMGGRPPRGHGAPMRLDPDADPSFARPRDLPERLPEEPSARTRRQESEAFEENALGVMERGIEEGAQRALAAGATPDEVARARASKSAPTALEELRLRYAEPDLLMPRDSYLETQAQATRAHAGSFTPEDAAALRARLQQDPNYLESLTRRGRVIDGRLEPALLPADVDALRGALARHGGDAPAPSTVDVHAPTARHPPPDVDVRADTVDVPPSRAPETERLPPPDLPEEPGSVAAGFWRREADPADRILQVYGPEGQRYTNAYEMVRAELGDDLVGVAGSIPEGRARIHEWPVTSFDEVRILDKLPSNLSPDAVARLPPTQQRLFALKQEHALPSDLDVVVRGDPTRLQDLARRVYNETGVLVEFTEGTAPATAPRPHAPDVDVHAPTARHPPPDVDVRADTVDVPPAARAGDTTLDPTAPHPPPAQGALPEGPPSPSLVKGEGPPTAWEQHAIERALRNYTERGRLTPADEGFLKRALAENPRYLEDLPTRPAREGSTTPLANGRDALILQRAVDGVPGSAAVSQPSSTPPHTPDPVEASLEGLALARHRALREGVPTEVLDEMEALAHSSAPGPRFVEVEKIRLIDEERLRNAGFDTDATLTPAGELEAFRLSNAWFHLHQQGVMDLTPDDVAFLRARVAEDPRYLEKIPMRGTLTYADGVISLLRPEQVAEIAEALRTKGVDVPQPGGGRA